MELHVVAYICTHNLQIQQSSASFRHAFRIGFCKFKLQLRGEHVSRFRRCVQFRTQPDFRLLANKRELVGL